MRRVGERAAGRRRRPGGAADRANCARRCTGLPFGEEVADLVEETYRAGQHHGQGVQRAAAPPAGDSSTSCMWIRCCRRSANWPRRRLRAAVEAAPELTAARAGSAISELADAGYHAQVHVEEHTSFVFLLENGKRLALRRNGDEYVHNGRRFTSRGTDGPGGVALAQRPAAAGDAGFDAAHRRLHRRPGRDRLSRAIGGDLSRAAGTHAGGRAARRLHHPRQPQREADGSLPPVAAAISSTAKTSLRERIAARLVPPALADACARRSATVEGAVARLRAELAGFDPTLAQALDRSARKIHYQLGKMERKTGREAMRRDERAARDAASLYGLIYPERHLQERLYSILPFLAKHGLDLIDQIYDAIELDCSDHRVMVV